MTIIQMTLRTYAAIAWKRAVTASIFTVQHRKPQTDGTEKQYRLLQMPVAIVAGAEDRLTESEQSAHLHRDIPHSTLRRVPGTGHMVHQTATGEIMTAIDMVLTQIPQGAQDGS
jgi:pimeloyl-ACP methyl ester carboxylesterase